jgi:DNA-binding beta-propeller fold protein YncE
LALHRSRHRSGRLLPVPSISNDSIQSDGSLAYLTTTAFASGKGIRPFDARLDPAGRDLYVVDAALNAVSGFAVSGGSLTELPSSPFALPAGATPLGIAVTGSQHDDGGD